MASHSVDPLPERVMFTTHDGDTKTAWASVTAAPPISEGPSRSRWPPPFANGTRTGRRGLSSLKDGVDDLYIANTGSNPMELWFEVPLETFTARLGDMSEY